jgi:hypothetical protein
MMTINRVIIPLLILLCAVLACSLSSNNPSITDLAGGVVPLPPNQDYGVLCFVELEDSIIANAPVFNTFSSQDGGLTWQQSQIEPGGIQGSDCNPGSVQQKELWATPDGSLRYRFEAGKTIEFSDDQGMSWQQVYDLSNVPWEPVGSPEPNREVIVQPGPLDAMIDHHSGNLLLAMGHAGILVRLPSGEWHWVSVGQYVYSEIKPTAITMSEVDMHYANKLPPFEQITPEFEINTENNYVNAMVFSPNGEQLAVSGFGGGIKLFDFPDGDMQYWLKWGSDSSDSRLYGAVFSLDGETLCTCGTNVDQTLRFWDVGSWELINEHDGYQTSALDTGRYENEQYFAIGLGPQVKIFLLPEGREITSLNSQLSKSNVASIRFISETNLIAVGGTAGGVELWDFEKREIVFSLHTDHQDDGRKNLYHHVISLGYIPSEGILIALMGDGRLSSWYIENGEAAWQLALPVPHGWFINTSAFSPDKRVVAVGMHNGPMLVFDCRTGEMLTRQWITDGGTLQQLAFSPDGRWLAAGFTTGKLKVWQGDGLIQ